MEIEFNVDIQEPLAMFDEMLNWRQRRSVLTSAKRAGGNVVRKRAAQLAPVGSYPPNQVAQGRTPGRLKRSLNKAKTGLVITKRNKNVYVVAGISDEDPYYAMWVDQGHGGPRPAPPKLFMQRAVEETEQQVVKAFTDKFVEMTYKQVEKAVAKARAKR